MTSKVEAGKMIDKDSNDAKLFGEIDTISKALYPDKTPHGTSTSASGSVQSPYAGKMTQLPDRKSKYNRGNEVTEPKEKKSFWKWRRLLKALSKRHKFKCCFSLQVHSIEGLPSSFDDLYLLVHWKRRDGELTTYPAKVVNGKAEFEEQLTYTCSVSGSKSGPQKSAKYDAKHILLFAAIYGLSQVDLGKHRIDLTNLLPLTLEELEEKNVGIWKTSFPLAGKAKGATMTVSIGYMVVGENTVGPGISKNPPEEDNLKLGQGNGVSTMRHGKNLPTNFDPPSSSQSVEDIKGHQVDMPASGSELVLHQKSNKETLGTSADWKPKLEECTESLDQNKPNIDSSNASGRQNIETEYKKCQKISEESLDTLADFKHQVDQYNGELEHNKLDIDSVSASVDRLIDKGYGDNKKICEDRLGSFADFKANLDPCSESLGRRKPNIDSFSVPEERKSDELDAKAIAIYPSKFCSEQEGYDTSAHEVVLSNKNEECTKRSIMEDLESALSSVSKLEALDSSEEGQSDIDNGSDHKMSKLSTPCGLDDTTESVANEFLNMLGIEEGTSNLCSESELESPRERLLRQFEKEAVATGLVVFGTDEADQADNACDDTSFFSERANFGETIELSSMIQAAEKELQIAKNKTRAKMLEDLETDALMRQWGLNEKAYQYSPPKASCGFESSIDPPMEEPPELPPLGQGLGPYLQTKNGGFLRSMNPALFRNSKSGGSLIMQASSPVVMPAEMGSNIMQVLQKLASVGIGKLSLQASKLMPLEDITGKTMQQLASESAPAVEGPERQHLLPHESGLDQRPYDRRRRKKETTFGPRSFNRSRRSIDNDMDYEFGSLEELTPLAMDKIEALSIEGLRIQVGMSDVEAPSNIRAQSIGKISALNGKAAGMNELEGAAGLQLLNLKDDDEGIDGLIRFSLTLDEWVKLDSGDIDDGDQISDRASKILAAHHAGPLNSIDWGSKGVKTSNRRRGLLGNNLTVALMVQLHDPYRNYETVGAPMLELVQVERVFIPPKQKLNSNFSGLRKNDNEDKNSTVQEKIEDRPYQEKFSKEESVPIFKIDEVHMAGVETDPGRKKPRGPWGTLTQQQSGSRWLLANGMGKGNKHPLVKAKTVSISSAPGTRKVQPGDTLWSMSSYVHSARANWKGLEALNPRLRNPDIIFPHETVMLR